MLTAVDSNLEPVLIETANEENEILVVLIKIGGSKITIINCYGPQEDDTLAQRLAFWQAVEQEVIAAKKKDV